MTKRFQTRQKPTEINPDKRRSFLKMLAASPIAAASLKDAMIPNIVPADDIRTMQPMSLSGIGNGDINEVKSVGQTLLEEANSFKAWQVLTGKLVPDHIYKQIEREAQHINYFDPDLAANRSYSLSAKLYHQRKRYIERRSKDIADNASQNYKRSMFRDQFKFDIW